MIAVTGASGLLGRFIIRKLIEESYQVVGLKRAESNIKPLEDLNIEWKESDILDYDTLVTSLNNVHTVIHTAALVSFNPRDADNLHTTNVEGTQNVVNTCLRAGVKRLIHISSVAALGRQKGMTKITEESKWVESNLNSDYAESKYLAELEVFRGQEEGLQIDIVNPSIILSQADWDSSSSQLFKYVWKEKPYYTEGLLNYVDVRDVVKVVHSLLQRENGSGSRWIANGGATPAKELLSQIAIRFEKRPPRIKVSSQLVGVAATLESIRSRIVGREPIVTRQTARMAREMFHFSNQKAIQQLGITFRPLEETLDWCCPYYRQNATINN